jgi:hypothetical protein
MYSMLVNEFTVSTCIFSILFVKTYLKKKQKKRGCVV